MLPSETSSSDGTGSGTARNLLRAHSSASVLPRTLFLGSRHRILYTVRARNGQNVSSSWGSELTGDLGHISISASSLAAMRNRKIYTSLCGSPTTAVNSSDYIAAYLGYMIVLEQRSQAHHGRNLKPNPGLFNPVFTSPQSFSSPIVRERPAKFPPRVLRVR